MPSILNKDDERIRVRIRVRNILNTQRFFVNTRSPLVGTGEQGELYFWEHGYPAIWPNDEQIVKIWRHGAKNNVPYEGDVPRQWVSNYGDVPFDLSFCNVNSDIKTVKTYKGRQVKVNDQVEVLSTQKQANELENYILVYAQEKKNREHETYLTVQICLCTKVEIVQPVVRPVPQPVVQPVARAPSTGGFVIRVSNR